MGKKATAVFMIFCIAAFLLCSCSDSLQEDLSEASQEEERKETVTLRFAWWGNEERAEKTNQAVVLFMEKNPDIIVKTVSFPFDEYVENLDISAKTGYIPDVWQGYVGTDGNYMDAGLVEPLDELVSQGALRVTDIPENLLRSGKIGEKLYGIPFGCNVKCMAIDSKIYESVGLQIPEKYYESWDALGEDLALLAEKEQSPMAGDIFHRGFLFEYFCRQRGETVYGQTGQPAIGFSEETYVDYYEKKLQWDAAGWCRSYEDIFREKNTGKASDDEKYAVYTLYSNQYRQLCEKTGQELELILLPGPDTDKGTDIRPGSHLCISSVSEHKEEAARLIDFLINDEEANRIMGIERGIPVSNKVRDALMPELDEESKAMAMIVELAEECSSPGSPVRDMDTSSIDDDVTGGMLEDLEQKIMFRQLTPEEAYRILYEKYGQN